jgi:hypothetical protein
MKNIFYLQHLKDKIVEIFQDRHAINILRLFLIAPFYLFGISGHAQVSTQIDTTTIRIGEQIHYQIIVEETDEVEFPKLELDSLKRIEVAESFKIDTLKNRLIKKYALTSFDSGRYVLPAQTVLIRNKKFLTNSFIIDVATIQVDTIQQPMHPIKDIKNEPYTFDDFKKYLWWLLAILLLVAVILYFVLRKKPTPEEVIARIPPFELAKKRLQELDSKQLWQQNRIKQYYVELTDIVRTFIEREMNIPALESTTDELLETISDFNESSKLDIPKDTILKLKKLLQEADLVKFAKSKPLSNEIELHRNQAENIIDNLHPKFVEKNIGEENGK